MQPSPKTGFQITILALGVSLTAQALWLLLAQALVPGITRLPTDAAAATVAARHRLAAAVAATIGGVRGDLWAQSAYTYANILWDTTTTGDTPKGLTEARASLDHALSDAPNGSGVWLLLAGLASRYPSPGTDALQALKMSYYTGPRNSR